MRARVLLGPLLLLVTAAEPALAVESEGEALRSSQPAPTVPPLVPVDSDSPDTRGPEYPQVVHRDGQVCVQTLSADGAVVEACRADPAVAKAKRTGTELEQPREHGARTTTVPSRVGVVAVAGAEGTFTTDGTRALQLRPRVGAGVRVALTSPEAGAAMPSLAVVGGYAGLLDHRLFAELRVELLVPQAVSLLMPGFTAYALGGVDAVLSGGVDPYVGVGVGWDHNIFAPSGGKTSEAKSQASSSPWSKSER